MKKVMLVGLATLFLFAKLSNYVQAAEPAPKPPSYPSYLASQSEWVDWSEKAIEWAKKHVGSRDYENNCLLFVGDAFMKTSEAAGRKEVKKAGWDHPNDAIGKLGTEFYSGQKDPPHGALLFFSGREKPLYIECGHIGISLGNDRVIHAYGTVQENSISEIENLVFIDSYRGWAYPPKEWFGKGVEPPSQPKVVPRWTVKEILQAGIFSKGFVSDDGVLYIDGSGLVGLYLYAIDIATGKVLKSHSLGFVGPGEVQLLGISKKAIYLFRKTKPYSLMALDRTTFRVLWDRDLRELGIGMVDLWWVSDYGAFYSWGIEYRNAPFGLIDENSGKILWSKSKTSEIREGRITVVGRRVALLKIPGPAQMFKPRQTNYVAIDISNGKTLWETEFGYADGLLIGQNLFMTVERKEQVLGIRLRDINTGELKWENEKAVEPSVSMRLVSATEQIIIFYSPLKGYTLWWGISTTDGQTLWEKQAKPEDLLYVDVERSLGPAYKEMGMVNGLMAVIRRENLYLVDVLTGKTVEEYLNLFPFFKPLRSDEDLGKQPITYCQDMLIVSSGNGLKAYLVTK